MQKKIDDETREILLSFVAEGYERLDDSEAQLSKIGDGDNTQELNSVFRLFHSVKGSAGYLGFENIKALTHEAETLLDVFLKEKIKADAESLDVIYATIDVLRSLIQIVETEFSDENGALASTDATNKIKEAIARLRSGEKPRQKENQEEPIKPESTEEVATTDEFIANEIRLSKLVTEDMVRRFLGECADLADRAEKIALSIAPKEKNPEAINDIFRAIHTMKGNAGFFGYALLESSCMRLESTLDDARKSDRPIGEQLINAVIGSVDVIRAAITGVELRPIGDETKAESTAAENGKTVEKSEPAKSDNSATAANATTEYRPLGKILVDMGVAPTETIESALAEQERPIGEILVQKGVVSQEQIKQALDIQKKTASGESVDLQKEIVRKEIRVDTAKLDKLFDLVGELITAESMVINSVDLTAVDQTNFAKSLSRLNKISREIQETTMIIRMIPLDGLFQKMTRLVRDLSRKMSRPVNFIVSGQDTEMDKNVIEQISDPLVHILRNAIDHGIESKENRLAAGKNESGTVHLNAKYEGSEIWISVIDDGAGLNREKILKKAAERGLLKTDPATISDRDAYAFIFEPGFSTAEKVSDVSGRGVGLDVVKKNLELIRGRIEIKTELGKGTEFLLAIPLTMAIIDGITVRVGDNRYSIPLGDIIEFFKASSDQITRTDKSDETVNIRSEFLPLLKLADIYEIRGAISDPREGIVIVVQNNGRKACLLIDEVIGNQQIVVKSLSSYLGKVDGISGCSILGDGNVSFIIDTGKLLAMRIE